MNQVKIQSMKSQESKETTASPIQRRPYLALALATAKSNMPAFFRLLTLLALLTLIATFSQAFAAKSHAVSIYGDFKYKAGFKHFEYANPNAPKGGEMVLGALGSYDSFNMFIVKGETVSGFSYTYDTLLEQTSDEHSRGYGLLAETIEYDEKREYVTFTLRKQAIWHDGKPVTPEDVIWTFNTLLSQGAPFFKFYYQDVKEVKKTGPRSVTFSFKKANREMPLILGQLNILPKHYWQSRDFSKSSLEPPLGSGPYKVKNFDAGKFVTYERVRNYWGKDIPVNKGRYNIDEIRYEYYKSLEVLREALKSGKVDFFSENTSKEWAVGYDTKAVKNGLLKKELIPHENTQGMQGFAFNLRKSIFKDRRVREALALVFDFEWANRVLFYNAYTRSRSYFNNSELASSGLPSKEERRLLEPLRGKIPEEVFTKAFLPSQTDGSGQSRSNLRKANTLLKQAGWTVQAGVLQNSSTGEKMKFQILLVLPAFERVAGKFVKDLEKLGVQVQVNTINTAQYINRVNNFDFDMIVQSFGQSDSPGNEQLTFWGSASADIKGSRNVIGIKDPSIDTLVKGLIASPGRDQLITYTKALDRVLLWNHFLIPHWYLASFRVLYWDKFGMPEKRPPYNLPIDSWWVDSKKAADLKSNLRNLR